MVFMKVLNKLFFSKSGFSMIELMVGGALVAGLGLTAATLFKNQKSSQKSIDHLQDLNNFHKNLSDSLSRVTNCNATFRGFYNQSKLGDITEIKECKLCTIEHVQNDANNIPDATRLYGVDDFIVTQGKAKNLWKISKLQLMPPAAPADPSKTGVNKLIVTYEMNPDVRKVQGGGVSAISKDILINARFHEGKFKSCYDMQRSNIDNLSSSICDMFQNYEEADETLDGRIMKWDEETQTCEQVSSIQTCPNKGEAIIGIDQNGQVLCLPIVNQMEVWNLVTAKKSSCAIGSNFSVKFKEGVNKLDPNCTQGVSSYDDQYGEEDESHLPYGGSTLAGGAAGGSSTSGSSNGGSVTGGTAAGGTTLGGTVGGSTIGGSTAGCSKPIDGNWSLPVWSECSTGSKPTRRSDRTCTNPAPSCGGKDCSGNSVIVENCECVPEKSCAAIIADTCSGNISAVDSCGNSCGAGTKSCPIVGTSLVRMDTNQEYWTSKILSSGQTLWSGGRFCYMSRGPIYEVPVGLQQIDGTPGNCESGGPNYNNSTSGSNPGAPPTYNAPSSGF